MPEPYTAPVEDATNWMKNELIVEIRNEISRCSEKIFFERFMELALYHPVHGYYAAASTVPTGRAGDFFTNVSVGALYGEMIGRRLWKTWVEELARADKFTLVEQGAMDAQFAVDLLTWARTAKPDFFAAIEYGLVEPFAPNRERQRAKLAAAGLEAKVRWVSDWSEWPEKSITGAVFSNELIDSFPVRQVVHRDGQWHERFVTWSEDRFVFGEDPASSALTAEIARLEIPPLEGYLAEINLRAADWMRAVASRLQRGVVLTVDYGFPRELLYAPERAQGTLQGYRAHQRSDGPLVAVGQQDLTTHIDFTTLIETGEACGLQTVQFVDQHHFLMERVAEAEAERRSYTPKEIRQLQTLLHPEMLGTRFRYLMQKC